MYTASNIDDYTNTITLEETVELLNWANKYKVVPVICAWYDDEDDFCQDWVRDHKIWHTDKEALRFLKDNEDKEFVRFSSGRIARIAI